MYLNNPFTSNFSFQFLVHSGFAKNNSILQKKITAQLLLAILTALVPLIKLVL